MCAYILLVNDKAVTGKTVSGGGVDVLDSPKDILAMSIAAGP